MQEILASQLEKDIWESGAETEYSGKYNGYRIYCLGGMIKPEVHLVLWRKEVGRDAYEQYHVGAEYSLDEAIDLVVSHRVAYCVERNDYHNQLRYGVREEKFVRVSDE